MPWFNFKYCDHVGAFLQLQRSFISLGSPQNPHEGESNCVQCHFFCVVWFRAIGAVLFAKPHPTHHETVRQESTMVSLTRAPPTAPFFDVPIPTALSMKPPGREVILYPS